MQIISWDQSYAVFCMNNKLVGRNSKRKNIACMLTELLRSCLTNALRADTSQFIGNNKALMEKN